MTPWKKKQSLEKCNDNDAMEEKNKAWKNAMIMSW
jgi:hypothetical protein